MDEVLTADEVAERFKVSASMIRKQTALGALPHFRIGTSLRYRASELEEWMKQITYRPRGKGKA